jgi:hypothetical protein
MKSRTSVFNDVEIVNQESLAQIRQVVIEAMQGFARRYRYMDV